MKRTASISKILLPTLALLSSAVVAQESEQGEAAGNTGSAAAQANNPLADMTAFNIQDYYIGELTESDESANQGWFRFATPFSVGNSNWLFRASLPINTFPTAPRGGKETGVGDLNVFAAYLIDTGNPAISFGVGPQLTAPTAGKDELGSEKWSAGFANVLFNASSPTFQYGYLLTWQESFAGDDGREDVNAGAFQPFAFYQLGGGNYLRAAPIWVYNFENDNYSMPLGIGAGKVIKKDKTVYNIFVEPQFSVADKGPNQPEWQIFLGFNMQFMN
ncbi:hypothetical protein [Alcanivorax sp.]|uniref:hypothetical protein n=1 Tax=Alcanivorax sp. TaxID=1872427 RepID=UPI000C655075|nr:hypothetical protein [Alcanivorax sp.]MBQ26438.1 hypothetical protein [Alcanivorax sp.]|tara:strand:- start:1986 stop:2810 length:825 start_codon:yes stop_codon:yes gene_type:complete